MGVMGLDSNYSGYSNYSNYSDNRIGGLKAVFDDDLAASLAFLLDFDFDGDALE